MHNVQVPRFASSELERQIFLETIPEKMHSNERKRVDGERGRTRTCDPCLKRALLYQLSYAPTII